MYPGKVYLCLLWLDRARKSRKSHRVWNFRAVPVQKRAFRPPNEVSGMPHGVENRAVYIRNGIPSCTSGLCRRKCTCANLKRRLQRAAALESLSVQRTIILF